jgi:isoamylase
MRALAFTLAGVEQEPDIHVMMNMYWQPLEFELPSVTGRGWFRAVDTALLPPNDFSDPGTEVSISGSALLQPAEQDKTSFLYWIDRPAKSSYT